MALSGWAIAAIVIVVLWICCCCGGERNCSVSQKGPSTTISTRNDNNHSISISRRGYKGTIRRKSDGSIIATETINGIKRNAEFNENDRPDLRSKIEKILEDNTFDDLNFLFDAHNTAAVAAEVDEPTSPDDKVPFATVV